MKSWDSGNSIDESGRTLAEGVVQLLSELRERLLSRQDRARVEPRKVNEQSK